jgi:hypothetical protein
MALLACVPKTATHRGLVEPTQADDSAVSTPADECRAVSDMKMLKAGSRSLDNANAWIAGSDDGILKLATLWPPSGRFAEVMLANIGDKRNVLRYGDPSMGYDAERTAETISAGPLWCRISAAFFRRDLALAEVRCRWDFDATEVSCLKRRYSALFAQVGLRDGGTETTARAEFTDVLTKMQRSRLVTMGESAEYGLSASPTMPEPLARAEHLLSDPLARLHVGSLPGRGSPGHPAQPPAGFNEAKELVDAESIDALRRILRGPNPEGRGFAAVGLRKLNALAEDDLRIIEQLKDMSSITTQGGCMVVHGSARDFFSNLESYTDMFEPPNSTTSNEPKSE